MPLILFLLKRHVFVTLAYAGVFVFGSIAFFKLNVEFMPGMDMPKVSVVTRYSKGTPTEIDALVTEKIEESLATVEGMRLSRSVATDVYSVVELFFEWGYDIDRAMIDIRKNLDLVKNSLPRDAQRPILIRGGQAENSELVLAVENLGYGDFDFEQELKKNVKGELLRVPGSGAVRIQGLQATEAWVQIKPWRMESASLDIKQIAQKISDFNVDYPVGKVYDEDKEYPVRIAGRFESLEIIKRLPLLYSESGGYITLENIADVFLQPEKETSYAKVNNRKTVLLECQKEAKANTLEYAKSIKARVAELDKRYSGQLKLSVVQDQSKHIKKAIRELLLSVLVGLLIGFGVLYFFYRNALKALIVLLSIPLSFLILFLLMHLLGMSINLMSLGGMALGSGMLLDASILSMDRLLKHRLSPDPLTLPDGIAKAMQQVSGSIFSSTLSTLAVFVPILFLEGLISTVFREMAIILSLSLIVSVVISLTFLPIVVLLLHQYPKLIDALYRQDKGYVPPHGLVTQVIERLRRFPMVKSVMVCLAFVLLASFYLSKKEVLPFTEMHHMVIDGQLPGGATLAKVKDVEAVLGEHLMGLSEKESMVYAKAGWEKNRVRYYETSLAENSFQIHFLYPGESSRSMEKKIRSFLQGELLQSYPGLRVEMQFVSPAFTRNLKDKRDENYLMVSSYDRDRLTEWMEVNLDARWRQYDEAPGLFYSLDKEQMAGLGVSPAYIGEELKNRLEGSDQNVLIIEDESVPIRVLYPTNEAFKLEKQTLTGKEGKKVDAKYFMIPNKASYPTYMYRQQGKPIFFYPKPFGDASMASLDEKLKKGKLEIIPSNLQIELEKSTLNFLSSFLLSCFFIYLILSAQFNSFIRPFYVLSIILPCMGLAGWCLIFTGNSINLFSAIGMILITGTAVNNAILIFEEIERSQNLGEAIKNRLLPISITTATTLLTLMPVAFNPYSGNEYNSDIALTLLGGMVGSFLFSLLVVPVFFQALGKKTRI